MSWLDGVDWEVVAIFAGLVLVEGIRRLPAGSLVVRTIGWSGWAPAGEPEPGSRWQLVSWWPPLVRSLVLPPATGAALRADAVTARVAVARRFGAALSAAGGFTLLALIFGLPIASARLGKLGFLIGAVVVLMLAVGTASLGTAALRRLEVPPRVRRRRLLGWCSPFASGRVVEGVYEAALAGASPAQALRALAYDVTFAQWARRRAYDVVRGSAIDADLTSAADEATLSAIVSLPPVLDQSARSFCPRCGATWLIERGNCPDCGVALQASFHSATPDSILPTGGPSSYM